ncbi:MAG: hypothetical protein GY811_22890 [Myxococcales bacterium]|nr:hypothetical protein [Myxococcales bacterium]
MTIPTATGDDAYLSELIRTLMSATRAHRPQLIYYVAGTDVLAADALGDFALSEDGVMERDRVVLELATELGASTVVTLAGGLLQSSVALGSSHGAMDSEGGFCSAPAPLELRAFADSMGTSQAVSFRTNCNGCNSDCDTLSLAGTYEEPNPGVQR